jgi:exopolysaccharide biosynthesis polyprenyl glycosylphosphotransferase
MSDHVASLARTAAGEQLTWPVHEVERVHVRGDRTWTLARVAADASLLGVAGFLTGAAGSGELGLWWQGVAVLLALAGFGVSGAYLPRVSPQLPRELARVAYVTAAATLTAVAGAQLLSRHSGAADAAVVHWLVASSLLAAGRMTIFTLQRAVRGRPGHGSRVLIVGAGEVGHTTAKRLLDEPQLGLRPVGFLDKEPLLADDERERRLLPRLPVLGASWDLERVVAQERIEHVVVAFSTAPTNVLVGLVRRCWRLGVGVMVIPRLYEVEGRRPSVHHLGALPLVGLHSPDPLGWQFRVKYALDRVVAGIALIALSPLVGLVAAALLATSGRPLLFRQRRVGRDGHVFDMLKFRTMRGTPEYSGEADAAWAAAALGRADAVGVACEADRRTRLGTVLRWFSLDELPQLWNIVRGDMSLVGPRPERVNYVEHFDGAVPRYPDRRRVKGGLTGWAQINGLRGETSLADRVEWDNFYIENWSPWLDLKILALTLPAILSRRRRR